VLKKTLKAAVDRKSAWFKSIGQRLTIRKTEKDTLNFLGHFGIVDLLTLSDEKARDSLLETLFCLMGRISLLETLLT